MEKFRLFAQGGWRQTRALRVIVLLWQAGEIRAGFLEPVFEVRMGEWKGWRREKVTCLPACLISFRVFTNICLMPAVGSVQRREHEHKRQGPCPHEACVLLRETRTQPDMQENHRRAQAT